MDLLDLDTFKDLALSDEALGLYCFAICNHRK